MASAVVIMAKHPYAAAVKTRLSPRLDASARAHLYRAFLADKLLQVRGVREAECLIAYTPAEERAWFAAFAGAEVALWPQCEGDLGRRLGALFEQLLPRFEEGVTVVDSDTPTLPLAYLLAGVRALRAGDELVIGPAEDGGYYLIGLARRAPMLFDTIEWSSPRTRAQTLAAAAQLGMRTRQLEVWYDVDEPADLRRLQCELARGEPSLAPHTRGALAELGLACV